MKRDVSPSLIIVGVVITRIMLGGLYYRFMGAGSAAKESAVASPYGLPKPGEGFKTPPPGGSARRRAVLAGVTHTVSFRRADRSDAVPQHRAVARFRRDVIGTRDARLERRPSRTRVRP